MRWAVDAEDLRLGRAAITVLATLDDPEARSMLRELMLEPDISRELKLHAVVLTRMQGKSVTELLPASAENVGDALVDIDALMADLPVGDRQLVRFADEVLDRDYDIRALPALAMMWASYRRLRGTRGDPLKRVEASAAALAYNFLLANGTAPDIGRLSRAFGCDARQLVFCARRIAAILDQNKGG